MGILHFEGGENPSLHKWTGFVGKGSIEFWGEAGEGCTLRKKA